MSCVCTRELEKKLWRYFTVHSCRFSVLCVFMCDFKSSVRAKSLLHWTHTWGRAPVCVDWCLRRFPSVENKLLHDSQRCSTGPTASVRLRFLEATLVVALVPLELGLAIFGGIKRMSQEALFFPKVWWSGGGVLYQCFWLLPFSSDEEEEVICLLVY